MHSDDGANNKNNITSFDLMKAAALIAASNLQDPKSRNEIGTLESAKRIYAKLTEANFWVVEDEVETDMRHKNSV